jgi:hypothetical protein
VGATSLNLMLDVAASLVRTPVTPKKAPEPPGQQQQQQRSSSSNAESEAEALSA